MNWLEHFLVDRGFVKVLERDARPRGWGAGEVDLLAWDPRCRLLWVIEIKEHKASRLGDRPLITPFQRARLKRSCFFYRSIYPGYVVALALLWRDPETARLEFLENP